MNHREKLRLARKIRTPQELKDKVPVFTTKAWKARKAEIEERVKKEQNEI